MIKKVVIKKQEGKKEINTVLVENFVSLQKVLTNLAFKIDNLTDQMSKLLNLFEISAKNFAEKQAGKEIKNREKDKDFLQKIDALLDQNKTIARGLTLMEEKIRQRVQENGSQAGFPQINQNISQRFPMNQNPLQLPPQNMQEERDRIVPRKLPSF